MKLRHEYMGALFVVPTITMNFLYINIADFFKQFVWFQDWIALSGVILEPLALAIPNVSDFFLRATAISGDGHMYSFFLHVSAILWINSVLMALAMYLSVTGLRAYLTSRIAEAASEVDRTYPVRIEDISQYSRGGLLVLPPICLGIALFLGAENLPYERLFICALFAPLSVFMFFCLVIYLVLIRPKRG